MGAVFVSDEKLAIRFWKKVLIGEPNDCWPWLGSIAEKGYGHAWYRQKHTRAHRVAWIFTNGAIPASLIVRHSCDNPPCCNPQHLLLGTHKDNAEDRDTRGRNGTINNTWSRKLTPEQVKEITCKYKPLLVSTYTLAEEYGVSPSTINAITSGRNWNGPAARLKRKGTNLRSNCKYGHELSYENVIVVSCKDRKSGIRRRCRLCVENRKRQKYKRCN